MADAPLNCKRCGRAAHHLYYNHPDRNGFGACCELRVRDNHVYTGRKMWLGSEVYGNKLGRDELRVDTEAAMLGGSGAGLKG